MTSYISACGLDCHSCQFYGNQCSGCHEVQGKPFWAEEHLHGNPCPIYDCSINKKKFKNCGPCADLPCDTIKGLKDPNSTEEEHQQGIERRVHVLQAQRNTEK